VRHSHAARNPVGEVERPTINRDEGATLAFSKAQARKVLDAPQDTIAGLRDRAILSVGLQVGLRRAEIAALKVGDLHQNRGYDSLRVARKGGRRDALAINPQTAARIRAYLEMAGHGTDIDGPLFRPLKHNGKRRDERRRMDPDAIDRVVRKYAGELGLDRGYSAHSMRATFITTALENGAQLEDVQKAAGHRDPGTTKLYDRRAYNPEKAASFFATYCDCCSDMAKYVLREFPSRFKKNSASGDVRSFGLLTKDVITLLFSFVALIVSAASFLVQYLVRDDTQFMLHPPDFRVETRDNKQKEFIIGVSITIFNLGNRPIALTYIYLPAKTLWTLDTAGAIAG
jgi:hypothetical protein